MAYLYRLGIATGTSDLGSQMLMLPLDFNLQELELDNEEQKNRKEVEQFAIGRPVEQPPVEMTGRSFLNRTPSEVSINSDHQHNSSPFEVIWGVPGRCRPPRSADPFHPVPPSTVPSARNVRSVAGGASGEVAVLGPHGPRLGAGPSATSAAGAGRWVGPGDGWEPKWEKVQREEGSRKQVAMYMKNNLYHVRLLGR